MTVRYLVYVNQEKIREDSLGPGEHLAGRSHTADIHLTAPDISGKHLRIEVTPDGIFAENLSSHGTLHAGVPLTGRVQLKDGDALGLGKNTELRFEIRETAIRDDSETETVIPGSSAPAEKPEDRDSTRIPGPDAPEEKAEEPESASGPDAAPEVQKTDVMHTRLASLEEMNLLRNADRKRATGKMFKYILGVVLVVIVLILLYTLRSAPKEANLSWPVGPDGRELGEFADPGNGGHKAGEFSLAFPSIKGKTRVERKNRQIAISTRFGKDASVPLRIFFMEKQSKAFLTQDRKTVFAGMIADLRKDNRHWNLAQISDVFFIGSGNGLPCLSCEYRREADGKSWYGDILFFRTGSRAYVRLAETLVSERARGQNFISGTPFLKFSPQYLEKHWEGYSGWKSGANPDVMLDEVSRHLSKQAPFEWGRTYLLLQSILMESICTGNRKLEKTALNQLQRLRSMQSIWYNSQKIQYQTAHLNNDRHQENAVLELCKTVFSSPDDLRYFTLRRNVWE